jgi:hypothetical protein
VAMSASGLLRNDPSTPNPVTGHVIPLALRGLGARYMTAQEWASIAPYWYTFYVCLGFFLASLFARGIAEAYTGFMKGWREPDNR